eukprot:m.431790 g.431790  ORF g.431790 m.431790 type:complete len:105 (-) comp17350_c0_seq1:6381-6695(-)
MFKPLQESQRYLALPHRAVGTHRYDFIRQAKIGLSERDRRKGEALLRLREVRSAPRLHEEVITMLDSGYKAEIETIGLAVDGFLDLTWLCHRYLPHKLRTGSWI